MKKSGILGLIGAGAALVGVGLFKLLKKPDTVEVDDIVNDETVEVDDYEIETND